MNKIKKLCIPIVTACLIMNSMSFPALAKSEMPADSETVVVEEETTEEENSEQEEEISEEVASEDVSDTEEDVSEEVSEPEEVSVLDETEDLNAAGDVSINPTNFPDDNFRSFISSQYDQDGDGIIRKTEIGNSMAMNCSNKGIKDLKGIEYFTALKYLYCYTNQLTSLDVSKNTTLEFLDCDTNQLTSLDVSKNTALTKLLCHSNQLTSLDVSKNTALTELLCFNNQLSSLDVSKNTALTELWCHSNQLTSLDVSKNTALTRLYCDSNQLTSLDVSKNTALSWLMCHSNQLTSLDVRNCPKILEIMKTKEKVIKDGCVSYYVDYVDGKYLTLQWDESVKIITPDSTVVDFFDDVKAGAWYVPAVQYVYENNLMAGTNGGKSFSPSSNITRGMITTVLYSNEGKPATSIANPFSDVKDGAWYYNAVLWAKEKGVADGKSDGTFGPNNNITRQDLAMMLYAYAQYKNYNLDKNADALNGFSDAGKVSGYAKNAMTWAVTQGILSGKGGRLDPAGKATRAEFAQMIMKLLQKNQ